MQLIDSQPLSNAELSTLGEFLESLPRPDAMNLERLDGFFHALLAGPELVMPSEYWPIITGNDGDDADEPSFESEAQAQVIMSLVMRHWNAINRGLRAGERPVPTLLKDQAGVVHGNEWAQGFLEGISLRDDAWRVLLDDKELAAPILPILWLANENNPDPKYRSEPLAMERDQLLYVAAVGVLEMYQYFEPLRSAGPIETSTPFKRTAPKTGRNDPCSCGSGKKYKHCCLRELH